MFDPNDKYITYAERIDGNTFLQFFKVRVRKNYEVVEPKNFHLNHHGGREKTKELARKYRDDIMEKYGVLWELPVRPRYPHKIVKVKVDSWRVCRNQPAYHNYGYEVRYREYIGDRMKITRRFFAVKKHGGIRKAANAANMYMDELVDTGRYYR